jgi:hypothetical protein
MGHERTDEEVSMRLIIHTATVLLAVGVTVSAQDSTVKSRTRIEGDEAQLVSMAGCLRHDASTGAYTLVGTVDAIGERLTNEAKADKGDKRDKGAVGLASTYVLSPGNVNLKPHVGQRVQVAAAAVKPGHKDADVTVRDETKVDAERGRDSNSRSKTEVEIERGPLGQYTVVSVKPLGGTCAAH